MTRQVRRVATVMLVLFGALFVNLNVIQLIRADEFVNHPANHRLLLQEYKIQRGPIVVGDERIAFSVETDHQLKYLRRYDPARLYAHLVGYYSVIFGRAGLEAALNEMLTGTPTDLLAQNLAQLLGAQDPAGNVVRLTVDPAAQKAAHDALGDRPGAIVALDPISGAVLAHVSNPTYDPNLLSSHDPEQIRTYWQQLENHPDKPLANRATQRRYQPGSTMKLVVAAAALEHGFSVDTAFEDVPSYSPPGTTHAIRNYGGGTCRGGGTLTLAEALVVSCNTVFARLGVELGADALVEQAEKFGFNRRPPYELPVVESVIPDDLDPPQAAQAALGAFDVQATALQTAMVVQAIANRGVLMRPHVVAEVLDRSGRRVRGADSGPWIDGAFTAQAMTENNAAKLGDLMVRAVRDGTGRRAQIDGATVGGKTGTADPGQRITPHVWFAGFAATPDPGGGAPVPRVAVGVVLPNAGEGATGGGLAAPMARAVMAAALQRTGG
ncbi:MAG: penicillin-binding protein 2 [Actinobacteria bacterium]|nr:penicillin-binding protein 2 [Actinomycetota bacterium]